MINMFETLFRNADKGISIVISVAVIFILVIGMIVFYNNWKDQKAWERKRAERQDELAEKRVKELQDNNKHIANVLAENTFSIKDYGKRLDKHQDSSSTCLRDIDNKLDVLDNKVQIIGDCQDKLATKEMVEDVSEDIKEIRIALKK